MKTGSRRFAVPNTTITVAHHDSRFHTRAAGPTPPPSALHPPSTFDIALGGTPTTPSRAQTLYCIKPSSKRRRKRTCSEKGTCPKNPTGTPRQPDRLAEYLERSRSPSATSANPNANKRSRSPEMLLAAECVHCRRRCLHRAHVPSPAQSQATCAFLLSSSAPSQTQNACAGGRNDGGDASTHHSSHGVLLATGEPVRRSHSSFRLAHSAHRVSSSALMHLTENGGGVGLTLAWGTRHDWNERMHVPLRQRQLLQGWVLRFSVDLAGDGAGRERMQRLTDWTRRRGTQRRCGDSGGQ